MATGPVELHRDFGRAKDSLQRNQNGSVERGVTLLPRRSLSESDAMPPTEADPAFPESPIGVDPRPLLQEMTCSPKGHVDEHRDGTPE